MCSMKDVGVESALKISPIALKLNIFPEASILQGKLSSTVASKLKKKIQTSQVLPCAP